MIKVTHTVVGLHALTSLRLFDKTYAKDLESPHSWRKFGIEVNAEGDLDGIAPTDNAEDSNQQQMQQIGQPWVYVNFDLNVNCKFAISTSN
jgi:hypothetical protein